MIPIDDVTFSRSRSFTLLGLSDKTFLITDIGAENISARYTPYLIPVKAAQDFKCPIQKQDSSVYVHDNYPERQLI
jgi:hypothetical protein